MEANESCLVAKDLSSCVLTIDDKTGTISKSSSLVPYPKWICLHYSKLFLTCVSALAFSSGPGVNRPSFVVRPQQFVTISNTKPPAKCSTSNAADRRPGAPEAEFRALPDAGGFE